MENRSWHIPTASSANRLMSKTQREFRGEAKRIHFARNLEAHWRDFVKYGIPLIFTVAYLISQAK